MGLFSFATSLIGAKKMKKAADYAGKTINDAAQAGIAETARQFDQTRTDFAPYRELGANAVGAFGNLSGLNGDEAQSAALATLRSSPFYQSLYRAGEEATLANASATGGLRGGNTQASLFNLGEDVFAAAIDRELGMLSGGIGVGQDAVGATGAFGANAVNQQNNLRLGGAEALANARLTRAGITAQSWNNAGSMLDSAIGSFLPGGGGLGGIAKALF